MDEVDADPVDLGLELRQPVQPCCNPPEVVVSLPVARQLLQRLRLHTLRRIWDKLPRGPAGRLDPLTEVVQRPARDLNLVRENLYAGLNGSTHSCLLSVAGE